MKVLHLSKFYSPYKGGIEQVVQDICEGVISSESLHADAICDVLCVSNSMSSSLVMECSLNGVRVFSCPVNVSCASTAFSYEYVRTLRRVVSQYDIIHVHLPNPLANLALIFANLKDKIIILHWHSDIVKQKFLKILYSPLQKWMLKRANCIIATSPVYAESSLCLRPYSNKVLVIPIGITPRMVPDLKIESKIRQRYHGKKIIFSLGRHVYYKGFDVLIRAAILLPDDYVILIGGSGPLTPALLDLINSNGLSEKVHLLGRVEDDLLGSYFSASDVFCLPSVARSEAFGVVQIEAFSLGVPVVSCDIVGSGVAWVNENNVSGLVVSPGSDIELADALIQVIRNRAHFSLGAKARFEQLFLSERMNMNIVNLYKSLMRGENG